MHLPLRPLLLLTALALAACEQGQSQPVTPSPLPQDEYVQVYTNQNPAASYRDPYRQLERPGDDLEQVIVETIATAHSSIDVAIQELRLPRIAAALIERQRAGVTVRVIIENTYSRPYSRFTADEIAALPTRERDRLLESRRLIDLNGDGQLSQEEVQERDALVMIERSGIPWIDDTADGSAGSNLMHHKFLVVDGQRVIITSANFTLSDIHGDFKSPASRGNANNLLKIDSPDLATILTQEFNLMWGDGPGGRKNSRFGTKKPYRPAQALTIGSSQVAIQFSPQQRSVPWEQTGNGLIGKTLSTARESIAMALFVFSDQPLVNQLEPLHQKGVEIRALIEPGFAYRSYSEGLDMLGVALANDECQYEVGNQPWRSPITTVGVPRLPPGDMLHHKFGVVDQQTVITGSHNWTDAANFGNDEAILVIQNPLVAAHFQREFDRLYTNPILGVPPAIRKKAASQKARCSPKLTARQPLSDTKASTRTPATPSGKSTTAQGNHQRVNLNTASQSELEALPGVGPGLAKRIIAARQRQPFRSMADLDQVAGVGPKLLQRLQNRVTW